jgi:tetratricopeptide (TPR) repeat protein
LLGLASFGIFLFAQQPGPPPPKAVEPPEEDESLTASETFAFNPLQASKEITAGNFYAKKGKFLAASRRYDRATKWNPGEASAWFKLGEMREKLKDTKGAREAYAKFLELAPEGKEAAAVKKKLSKR